MTSAYSFHFCPGFVQKIEKKNLADESTFLNYENIFWLILYRNLKSLGLYNVSEKKFIITLKMDTPQIREKIGKYQLSVFLKSSWATFFNFFAQVGVETI